MANISYRPDIDGLRAIAVLAVVLHHLEVPGFGGGYVGVDVFFVISGYLITAIILPDMDAGRFSLRRFYERRIRRIFPALFLVLACSSLAAMLSFWPDRLIQYYQSLLAAVFFGSNILFWSQSGYFDQAAGENPLLHTWSLAVEEQFYLVYPLILLALATPGRWRGVWLWGLFALSLAVSIHDVRLSPVTAFYLLPARLWELLLGALLVVRKWPLPENRILREGLGLGALLALAWSIFQYDSQTRFPGAAALLPCIATALLIHVGGRDGLLRRLLGLRPLVFVGLISYSLYLWHWPLLVFAQYHSTLALDWLDKSLLLAASLVLATLSWRYVETPLRRRGRSPGRPFAAAATALLLFGALGLQGMHLDTWRPHFPATSLIEFTKTRDKQMRGDYPVVLCGTPDRGERVPGHCMKFGRLGAERKLVVWGDSHATSWSPAFFELAAELGYEGTLVAVPGCPPVLGVRVPPGRGNTDNCADPADAYRIFDHLTSLRPEVIFLIGRWSMYAHGLDIEGRPHHAHHRVAAEGDGVDNPSPAYSAQVLHRQIESTVRRLRAHGPVVMVRSIPTQRFTAETIARTPRFQRAGLQLALADHERRQALVNGLFDRLEAKGWIRSYDPANRLCDERVCHYGEDDTLYYLDSSHITATASKLFKQDLREFLSWPASSAETKVSKS